MSTPRKARGDSVLKTLPQPRQDEIAEFAREHTLAETRKWLADAGLKTSLAALSNFCSWHTWGRIYQTLENNTESFMALVKQRRPDLSESDVETFGNDFFQLQAIHQQDPEMFLKFRTARAHVRIERQKLELAERRVVLLEKKAQQADQTEAVLSQPMSAEERERRIKEIYGRA